MTTSTRDEKVQSILRFWFGDPAQPVANYELWFGGTPEIDADIRARFGADVAAAADGKLDEWAAADPHTCLALIVLMDQFALNCYRDEPRGYNTSAAAIPHAKAAIARKFDQAVPFVMRQFYYLPLMHSERAEDQHEMAALYEACGEDGKGSLGFAYEHRDIVVKYGRFPGRNRVMGRTSTADEEEYLKNGGVF